jgi:hypothetical protein
MICKLIYNRALFWLDKRISCTLRSHFFPIDKIKLSSDNVGVNSRLLKTKGIIMPAFTDTPAAHHYNVNEFFSAAYAEFDGQKWQVDLADVATPLSVPEPTQTAASDTPNAPVVPTDDELVVSWETEQGDLLLDDVYMSLIDEITSYAVSNPLLISPSDQRNWSLAIFGQVLNKVMPSQTIITDSTSLILKLIEIGYTENNLHNIDSKKRWVLSQYKLIVLMLYKNASTTDELIERDGLISLAESSIDPLLGADIISNLSTQEADLINSGDFHPLIGKIVKIAADNAILNNPLDQRNWSLMIFGEVLNQVIPHDQVKINDYPSLLIELMELAGSNPLLKRGPSKKEWVLDQFGMILEILYEGSSEADLLQKQDYLDSAGSIIDTAKTLYNQNINLGSPLSPAVASTLAATTISKQTPPSPIVLNSNPQTDPSIFKQEAIQQIVPVVVSQLTATTADLTENLAGPNRLNNLGPIIQDIATLIPNLNNIDLSTVVAIEIGVVEGVLTFALPLIPGGAVYLPIAMPLVPFAVKAFNLAAEGLFHLGEKLYEDIENRPKASVPC